MRLHLVNPDNPVVRLNKVHWNRLNTYRVWKPLGLAAGPALIERRRLLESRA
jgi:hypothetical protein